MGYQALLFCPDEKLARVVSQVFSELDFVVETVTEPFGAVKKLMAQHYDAVVIDCENEQNSSLLLKSAHTSTLNQGSLAIAIVEGQAGVARAYRIGANLVLTKPINIEQTKGTLRVARGLLRKNADTANATTPHASSPAPIATPPAPAVTVAPAPSVRPVEPANRIHQVAAGASLHGQSPEFATPFPAMAASAKLEEKPVPAPVPVPVAQKVVAPVPVAAPPTPREIVKSQVPTTAAPAQVTLPVVNTPSGLQGAATAPAPAKEIVAPPEKVTEKRKQDELPEIAPATQTTNVSTDAASTVAAPSFAALGDDNAGGSGSKKVLIAVAAVLVVAVGGYFGWTKFGQGHATSAPKPAVSAPQAQTVPAPVQTVPSTPVPAPAPSVGATTTNRTSPVIATAAPKPSAAAPVQSAAVPLSEGSQSTLLQTEARKAASSPLLVKPGAVTQQAQPEAAPVQPPSPLAVASPSANGLGSLLTSSSVNVAKPSLATLKVSQGVSQGMVIKRIPPKYPPNALSAHIQGAVQIEATVNKEGKVVNPKVLSGDAMLAAAALEAVKQWRYKPYYLDGEPVDIQTQITINFKVNQ